MKWLLWLEGEGEGCDYTIGCNTAVIQFDAPDLASAKDAAMQHLDDLGEFSVSDDDRGRPRIARAHLIPADRLQTVPLDEWRAEARALSQAAQDAKARAERRAEYERLKTEFGDS